MRPVGFAIVGLMACGTVDADGDGVAGADDCDDADPSVHPGATERCDGVDRDCDGLVDAAVVPFVDGQGPFYADRDGDRTGAGPGTYFCSVPGLDWVGNDVDCDDGHAGRRPGNPEVCNGWDDDCDDLVDAEDPDLVGGSVPLWGKDQDGDGHAGSHMVRSCEQPGPGFTAFTDCDDTNPDVHPGVREVCNGVDDDCDGLWDDADPSVDSASGFVRWFDHDGDGYGGGDPFVVCDPARFTATATVGGDCNDGVDAVSPAATEECNGIDDDCDSLVDDDDPSVPETAKPRWFADADQDGWGRDDDPGVVACEVPGAVVRSHDCDDGDATRHPSAAERCNGVDDDCDGFTDDDDPEGPDEGVVYALDRDGDRHATLRNVCGDAPDDVPDPADLDGYGDCDDGDPTIHPQIDDDACDGIVSDCSATRLELRVPGDVPTLAALALTPAFDTWICLGPGEHVGSLESSGPLRVVGEGPEATSWIASSAGAAATSGHLLRIEHLTLEGPPSSATFIALAEDLTMHDVVVEDWLLDTEAVGVFAAADLTLDDVVFRDIEMRGKTSSFFGTTLVCADGFPSSAGPFPARLTDVRFERIDVRPGAGMPQGGAEGGALVSLRGDRSLAMDGIVVRDVEVHDVAAGPTQRPRAGGLFSTVVEGPVTVRDVDIDDVVVDMGSIGAGGLFQLETGAGTPIDVRQLDVRAARIQGEALVGGVLAFVDGATHVEQVVVADTVVDAWSLEGGLVAHEGGGGQVPLVVRHVTLEGVELTTITTMDGAFAHSGGPTTDAAGWAIGDVTIPAGSAWSVGPTGPIPLVAAVSTSLPDVSATGQDVRLVTDIGFFDTTPTDSADWILHLAAGSPAIDRAALLPDDADGSPADAGAYGGPGGPW